MYFIARAIWKEKERGFGGVCLEADELHRKRGGAGRVTPYTDEEIEMVIERLSDDYKIEYYGTHKYLPSGCELYQNAKGGWVGRLLVVDYWT